jgi:hypothetical protein
MSHASSSKHSQAPGVTVYGHLDAETLRAIDRTADLMLMPRSWVVSQILREWHETRNADAISVETAWEDTQAA